jgi:hypothetical protein
VCREDVWERKASRASGLLAHSLSCSSTHVSPLPTHGTGNLITSLAQISGASLRLTRRAARECSQRDTSRCAPRSTCVNMRLHLLQANSTARCAATATASNDKRTRNERRHFLLSFFHVIPRPCAGHLYRTRQVQYMTYAHTHTHTRRQKAKCESISFLFGAQRETSAQQPSALAVMRFGANKSICTRTANILCAGVRASSVCQARDWRAPAAVRVLTWRLCANHRGQM